MISSPVVAFKTNTINDCKITERRRKKDVPLRFLFTSDSRDGRCAVRQGVGTLSRRPMLPASSYICETRCRLERCRFTKSQQTYIFVKDVPEAKHK